jgi:hypothetical protein
MKQSGAGFLLLGLLGLLACGGRVIEDPGSDGTGTPVPTTTPTGSAGKSGASKSDPSGALPTKELGECMPGFKRDDDPGRPCRWITESGMCFDKSDDACACVCPKQGSSVCAHGFDKGADGAVLVVCN